MNKSKCIRVYIDDHLVKEEQYKSAVNLLESLEEDDDVQNVYTNLKEKKLN